MNDAKYIGLDLHQATISATALDSTGKLVMESILETKAAAALQFIHGLRGSLHVTLEEGTWAAWLHDLLKPPCHASGGLRSAQECAAESRQQKRWHRFAETRPAAALEPSPVRLSRTDGSTNRKGTGTQHTLKLLAMRARIFTTSRSIRLWPKKENRGWWLRREGIETFYNVAANPTNVRFEPVEDLKPFRLELLSYFESPPLQEAIGNRNVIAVLKAAIAVWKAGTS